MDNTFPEVIYISFEQDGDERYPLASENIDGTNDGIVAEYKLVSVGEKTTETKYVKKG